MIDLNKQFNEWIEKQFGGPPGPPPRPGLLWNSQTHRWVRHKLESKKIATQHRQKAKGLFADARKARLGFLWGRIPKDVEYRIMNRASILAARDGETAPVNLKQAGQILSKEGQKFYTASIMLPSSSAIQKDTGPHWHGEGPIPSPKHRQGKGLSFDSPHRHPKQPGLEGIGYDGPLTVNKGLRGPQKGSTYRKQEAKFFEDVEPKKERNLSPGVRQAINQYKITRQPQEYQKLIAEMRRGEHQDNPYGDIKGFKRQPLVFAKLDKMLKMRLMKRLVKKGSNEATATSDL